MLTTANLNTLSCKTEGNNMIKKEIKLESYQSIADWYFEAGVRQREIDQK